MKKIDHIKSGEFDWLGYCTSCNADCCHNMDSSIPKNECTKPGIENRYVKPSEQYILNNKAEDKLKIDESKDNRPLECRLFPFDIREVDQKLVWILKDHCHATPKLDYEKAINFFERHFARTIPFDQIRKYVENNNLTRPDNYNGDNFKIIGQVKWPIDYNNQD